MSLLSLSPSPELDSNLHLFPSGIQFFFSSLNKEHIVDILSAAKVVAATLAQESA